MSDVLAFDWGTTIGGVFMRTRNASVCSTLTLLSQQYNRRRRKASWIKSSVSSMLRPGLPLTAHLMARRAKVSDEGDPICYMTSPPGEAIMLGSWSGLGAWIEACCLVECEKQNIIIFYPPAQPATRRVTSVSTLCLLPAARIADDSWMAAIIDHLNCGKKLIGSG